VSTRGVRDDLLEQEQRVRRFAQHGRGLARQFALIGGSAAQEPIAKVDTAPPLRLLAPETNSLASMTTTAVPARRSSSAAARPP
jgi:hypothetical protein